MLTYQTKEQPMVTIIIEEPLIVWLSNNRGATVVNTEKFTVDTEEELEAYESL